MLQKDRYSLPVTYRTLYDIEEWLGNRAMDNHIVLLS